MIGFRVVRSVVMALVLFGGLFVRAALAEGTPDFQLDFDTGGHRAFVKDLAFTADGEFLVSASDDKTIRIWDWRTGVSIRTIRGFIGQGNEGKIFAIAVSPDGKTIAAGGYFGKGSGENPPYGDVRLFDFATGKIKAVLKAQQFAVYDIAFSPDGKRLAAGGQDGFVYVWNHSGSGDDWVADTKLDADSWHIQHIAFADAGRRIVATTTDNGVRLWNADSGEEIVMPDAEALRDSSVMALAVSSDGTRFATGNADGIVQIWRAEDGSLLETLPKQDYLIGSLTFAQGGNSLVVSCGYSCADKNRTTVWKSGATQPSGRYSGHDGTVFASAATPDGALVATAGGTRHAIHIWDPATGERKQLMQGVGQPVTAVGINAAGTAIAWGNRNPCPDRVACPEVMGMLDFTMPLPTKDRFFERPQPLATLPADVHRAVLSANGVSLRTAAGGADGLENAILQIVRDGQVSASIKNDATNGYVHAAFTLINGGKTLVTGGNDGTLIAYDTATAQVSGAFRDGHTGEINGIASSAARKLLVTGSADQTLRLWNLDTHELIANLFVAGEEWILWVPQGYYNASGDGDRLIGWHVNQGPDKEGRFVRAGQLKKYLSSPEIVRRAIILGSATQAIKELRPGEDNELKRLLQRKPPEFNIKLAEDQKGVKEGFVAVEITGAQEAGADIADFSILSNARSIGQFASRSVGSGADGKKIIVEVPVEDGENQIRITGANNFGYLTERSVVALAKKRNGTKPRGKLYVVAIGVEKYPQLRTDCNGRSCDLRYPVDDAAEFLRVVSEKSAPLFSGMESLVLVNRESLDEMPEQERALNSIVKPGAMFEPDSDTISDQVQDFLDRPGPDDTTFIFVAGHGINIDEDYYFIPSDGRKQDAERWKRSSLVDWQDIQKSVERAKGLRFMLLDTCHAANAFNPRLEKDADDARIIVFSATAANNTAAELPELGHGVFTYSVLAGLRGAANSSGDGVRLLGLADYIYREVVRLTGSAQKPFYHISNMENILLAQP